MKRLFSLAIAMILATAYLPGKTWAVTPVVETTGTINIEIVDENNQPFAGNWQFYQGTDRSIRLLRNGSKGESFTYEKGTYYLGVHPVVGARAIGPEHKAYVVRSENPQTLIPGGEITYTVQYFLDEEQKELALSREAGNTGVNAPEFSQTVLDLVNGINECTDYEKVIDMNEVRNAGFKQWGSDHEIDYELNLEFDVRSRSESGCNVELTKVRTSRDELDFMKSEAGPEGIEGITAQEVKDLTDQFEALEGKSSICEFPRGHSTESFVRDGFREGQMNCSGELVAEIQQLDTDLESTSLGARIRIMNELEAAEAAAQEVFVEEKPAPEHDVRLRNAILMARALQGDQSEESTAGSQPTFELAATGSPALLIGLFSMMSGALLTRKRK